MNILIAYYSHTGTTRRAAEAIQAAVGGELFEIQEQDPYSRVYSEVIRRAEQEVRFSLKPPLRGAMPDIAAYDVIFIGSPNWCSTIAPPVATFLDMLNFNGKQLIPFVTHGSGGLAHMVADIRALCPTAAVDEGIDANKTADIAPRVRAMLA